VGSVFMASILVAAVALTLRGCGPDAQRRCNAKAAGRPGWRGRLRPALRGPLIVGPGFAILEQDNPGCAAAESLGRRTVSVPEHGHRLMTCPREPPGQWRTEDEQQASCRCGGGSSCRRIVRRRDRPGRDPRSSGGPPRPRSRPPPRQGSLVGPGPLVSRRSLLGPGPLVSRRSQRSLLGLIDLTGEVGRRRIGRRRPITSGLRGRRPIRGHEPAA
jgi:hypothetical protein